MPLDRRRRGHFRYLLSPLPWAWQDRIPSPATERLLHLAVAVWLLGPWPLAIAAVGCGVWRVYVDGRKLGERRTWHRSDVRTGRALWMVRVAEEWRWKLLRRTGVLWLPTPAPVGGGDVLLFDLRGEKEGELSVQFYMAGRVANPSTNSPRRHRRLLRLQSFWTLDKPMPLSALPETARVMAGRRAGRLAPPYTVRVVEPTDEEDALRQDRLEAKVSVREPRKPTWRHERRAHQLFHKLWSSQGPGVVYDKEQWKDLQNELNRAGVLV